MQRKQTNLCLPFKAIDIQARGKMFWGCPSIWALLVNMISQAHLEDFHQTLHK